MMCERLGVVASLDELIPASGYTSRDGATMLGLQRAARAKGLYAAGVKISIDELSRGRLSAIAYVWGNHFLLVEPADGDRFFVSNSPGCTELLTKAEFARLYSGFALLVARDRPSLPDGAETPDLRLEAYTWDFGSVYEGDVRQHSLQCRNAGNQPLVISDVTTPRTEGMSYTLTATLKPDAPVGNIKGEITIHTNNPDQPTLTIPVYAYVQAG